MKRSKVEFVQDILAMQMNHWFYISIALTIMGLFDCEKPHLFLCIVLGVLPLYGYFLRKKVTIFPLFMLLSVLPVIGSFLFQVDHLMIKVLLVLFSGLYGVYSIYLRTRSADGSEVAISPVVVFCVTGGVFYVLNSQRDVDWDGYFILTILIYFACYLIHYFTTRYLFFITVNDSSASNIPEKAIFDTGLRQTVLFTFSVTAFLAIVGNVEWLAKILSTLKKWIVAFISKYLQIDPAEPSIPMHQDGGVGNGVSEFFDMTGEPALIWIILQYVAIVALACGVVIAVVYGIYKGYRTLLSGFQKERKGKEQDINPDDDIHEKIEILRKEKERGKNIFSAFTLTERIRKAYRKRVEKEHKQIVGNGDMRELSFFTAKECCDIINSPGLKAAYEKARYSNTNCTNEDLRASKN